MGQLYDRIGTGYDVTRRADPEIVHRIALHLRAHTGDPVIDVACGTGNYTVELAKMGLTMTGADISLEMLRKAQSKREDISWVRAEADSLPFGDGLFLGATCILAIHHFNDLETSFREIYRVLKQGRLVIFTAAPEQMKNYWLNAYFPQAMQVSCNQMPTVNKLMTTLQAAGFDIVGTESFLIEPDLQDFFLYSGKHDPKMYLDSFVRRGISTFANKATPGEIEDGCERLRHDIMKGNISKVIQKYISLLGDYLFVVADK